MAKETRAAIAEQARVFTFLGFLGSAGCWFGFALELHAQLPPGTQTLASASRSPSGWSAP